MTRVCLIVDNPLRDLDGLVLVARALALRGMEAVLVPMYTQWFDVTATAPDIVLVNYVRPNNLELVQAYRRAGVKVGVLDTEGAGGRTADEFATLVERGGAPGNVDLYCVWGKAQHEALREMLADVIALTGCPRYDFCAEPWRGALDVPADRTGHVLINTNYPTVNPRFSSGSDVEKKNALAAGFDHDFAQRFFAAAKVALEGMIALTRSLATAFPEQRFVLRPHPFENIERYRELEDLPNFEVRQEGTSIEWLASAKLLVHLNCSTAVEAVMLGREPLTPAWLDAEALRVDAPSAVSRHMASLEQMIESIAALLEGRKLPADQAIADARAAVIENTYFAIDGRGAARVADAVEHCLAASSAAGEGALPRSSGKAAARFALVSAIQRLIGPRAWFGMMNRASKTRARKLVAKGISLDHVQALLGRLDAVDPAQPLSARYLKPGDPAARNGRQASGDAVIIAPLRENDGA